MRGSILCLTYSTTVLNIPRKSGRGGLSPSSIPSFSAYENIENEKTIYHRLADCENVVKCLQVTDKGIRLELMRQGSLQQYLESPLNKSFSLSQKLQLYLSAVEGLYAIHKRHILVFDVHPRNLLLTDNLEKLKYCDLTDSVSVSEDVSLRTIVQDGVCMQIDIFRLGSVLYAITDSTTTIPDLIFPSSDETSHPQAQEPDPLSAQWPETLRETEGTPLGEQIRRCWRYNGYVDSAEVYEDVRNVISLLDGKPSTV